MSKPLAVLQQEAKALNINVVEIISTVERMYSGWESDTEGWIVRLDTGKVIGLSTNHGSICRWTQQEIQSDLKEGATYVSALQQALRDLGAVKVEPSQPRPLMDLMLVREHRGGLAESLETQTQVLRTRRALCRWIQDHFGRDSSASGSGHVTVNFINSILKVEESSIDDSARAPGWTHTRTVLYGAQVVGYVNLESLEGFR